MIPIAECDRNNAGRFGACDNRRVAYLPVLATILGMKDPRRFGSARGEPDVILAKSDEASAAGSEGPLVRQGWRQVLPRKPLPIGSAVSGDDQLKLPFYWVAQGNAVLFIPESSLIFGLGAMATVLRDHVNLKNRDHCTVRMATEYRGLGPNSWKPTWQY